MLNCSSVLYNYQPTIYACKEDAMGNNLMYNLFYFDKKTLNKIKLRYFLFYGLFIHSNSLNGLVYFTKITQICSFYIYYIWY